jgi:hypothetical protein
VSEVERRTWRRRPLPWGRVPGLGRESRRRPTSFAPIAEALEGRVPPAERRLQVPPWIAHSRDPQHCLAKAPAIAAASAGVRSLTPAMRHLCPLGIRQDKLVDPKLESRPSPLFACELQKRPARLRLRSCPVRNAPQSEAHACPPIPRVGTPRSQPAGFAPAPVTPRVRIQRITRHCVIRPQESFSGRAAGGGEFVSGGA